MSFSFELLQQKSCYTECDECGDPCKKDRVDSGDDGPFPSTAFFFDGNEGGYAREIQKDEDHVCERACR